MRWFWIFIALLVVLTGVLYTQRLRAQAAAEQALQELQEASEPTQTRRSRARPSRSANDPAPEPTPTPAAEPTTQAESQQGAQTQPTTQVETPSVGTQPAPSSVDQPEVQQVASDDAVPAEAVESTPESSEPKPGTFDPGSLITMLNELDQQAATQQTDLAENDQVATPTQDAQGNEPTANQVASETNTQPEPTPQTQTPIQQTNQTTAQSEPAPKAEQAPEKSYELRGDGSFRVIASNTWVQGSGTQGEPYVLSWDVLKSIEKSYKPKHGQDKLPDWLDLLDGKFVSLEGHTLVPVVATTTRELLVMQNPWDGCCIGVPPTPYDAVEVVLNHDVDFGNSAVGYGSVQGTFYLDPYIVDGWVLGLYIIEDAKYRSGEGVAFPEF